MKMKQKLTREDEKNTKIKILTWFQFNLRLNKYYCYYRSSVLLRLKIVAHLITQSMNDIFIFFTCILTICSYIIYLLSVTRNNFTVLIAFVFYYQKKYISVINVKKNLGIDFRIILDDMKFYIFFGNINCIGCCKNLKAILQY